MQLTKEQAITLHRRMWRWIGLKTLKEKRCVEKKEWFEKFRLEWATRSWHCCKYHSDKSYELGVYPICDNCPIDPMDLGEIGRENRQGQVLFGLIDCEDEKERGLFSLWCSAFKDGNWQEAGKLALQIAELPEREET